MGAWHLAFVTVMLLVMLSTGLSASELFCTSVLDHNFLQSNDCQLKKYQQPDAVECVNLLTEHMGSMKRSTIIAFMGDSRMRQQFNSFLKLLPAEYFTSTRKVLEKVGGGSHADVDMVSKFLSIKLISRWRPTIDRKLFDELEEWTKSPPSKVPTTIVIGIGVHHMYDVYNCDDQSFERNLTRLQPVLARLARITDVIWWNQYPTFDYRRTPGSHPDYLRMYAEKLDLYNQVARRILRPTNVTIWTSGQKYAEEYIRACKLHHRENTSGYFHCNDFVHTGYVAIFRATQHLYNHLCNRLLLTSQNPHIEISPDVCCD